MRAGGRDGALTAGLACSLLTTWSLLKTQVKYLNNQNHLPLRYKYYGPVSLAHHFFFLVAGVHYQQLDRYSDYFKAVDTELHRDHIISLTIFNPFQPNISMHILHSSLNILVLTWRICQTIKSFFTSQLFPSFLQLYKVYLEVIL